ncbi:arginine--tRNA ligase [Treponema peruense]|uniref:Arginine--tRNA ligase n=1 Tax=Treponema peruense TaxID=2787628 RepID=A0A7T3V5K1_9SPIR|nr:arginine--tRNA ligase [Treponema peruense]QQA01662.1 arginine--tRNA ligase [Treponema peruense]
MADQKEICRAIVTAALNIFKTDRNIDAPDVQETDLRIENPPKPEMGDIGAPMFMFAKSFRMAPPAIAQGTAQIIIDAARENRELGGQNPAALGEFAAVGPYVNVKLNKANAAADILKQISAQGEGYGSFGTDGKKYLEGRRVMVEYSSPNTNKPLHLGHMRNDALGESVSRILKKAGAEVFRVNIINNRGVHICKSMLAYKLFHEAKGDTPQSLGIKGDHFVGQCYVEFDKYAKEHPEAVTQAEEMLVEWEKGNDGDDLHKLWKMMNGWTIDGIKQTYDRTGVGFEKLYFESDTYLKGREEILKGLEKGIFFKAPDGSVRIDVTDVVGKGKDGEDHTKVLLRKDGTSVYITQDIGTAIFRHNDWAFNQMVYVVASEQSYHFKILFHILKKLGYDWADKLYHLSYGLVNLPSGRMKSREGTVVDADDLIDSLHAQALKAINERGRDEAVGNPDDVAEKVALAALHYYLLQITPVKDMLYNPEESLSFNGNTGPYLQYMGARISSILRKASEKGLEPSSDENDLALLTHESEWALIKELGKFPSVVAKAADDLDPSQVALYLYDVCKSFSAFYRDCPILSLDEQNKTLARARLELCRCTLLVLKDAMSLVLVPFLDRM